LGLSHRKLKSQVADDMVMTLEVGRVTERL